MIRTTYVSRASSPMSAESLLELLGQCRDNNPPKDVTGLLLFANDTFLQTLEGDEKVVDELVDTISKDLRHTDIEVLSRRSVNRRKYPDWSMGFSQINDARIAEMEGIRDFGVTDFNVDRLSARPEVADTMLDNHQVPHWDPLVGELNAKEKTIAGLKGSVLQARGQLDMVGLVLEAVVDASRNGPLSNQQIELCESTLRALRGPD